YWTAGGGYRWTVSWCEQREKCRCWSWAARVFLRTSAQRSMLLAVRYGSPRVLAHDRMLFLCWTNWADDVSRTYWWRVGPRSWAVSLTQMLSTSIRCLSRRKSSAAQEREVPWPASDGRT